MERSLDDVQVHRILSPQDAIAHRDAFVESYQTIFSEPPYHEEFSPAEVHQVLRMTLSSRDHITLIARSQDEVVGFGFGVPLDTRPEIARHMHGLLPASHTFYLSELGVLPSWRGMGLGRKLIEERISHIDCERFTHVVLRVSVDRHLGADLYHRLGFEDLGVYMNVRSRRTDGKMTTDRRRFLSKVIPGSVLSSQH